MAVHGRYSYVRVGKETNKGVPPASGWVFLKHSSAGIKMEAEKIESKALTGRLVKYDTALGTRKWAGSIEGVELDEKNQGVLFKSFFGTETVTTQGANYKHTFKLSTNPADYVSVTAEVYKSLWLRQFVGCRVKGLTIKSELNAIVTLDAEVIGTGEIEKNPVADKATVTLPAEAAFRFYHTSVKVDNVEFPAKSLEISLKENADADFNFAAGVNPAELLRGGIEGTVKVSLNLNANALAQYEKWKNQTDVTLEIKFTKSTDASLSITFARCRVIDYSENYGDEVLKADITFEILSATNEDETVKVELINNREEEY